MLSRSRVLGRACAVLLALGGLGACVAPPGAPGYVAPPGAGGYVAPPTQAALPPSGRRIAVLVPLSGSNAELGRSMLRAARLALDIEGAAAFDEKDTNGTPQGAATAVRSAIAGGAGIVVGPLTTGETGAVAAITRPLNIPVLAFTSDESQAQPEVWPMGITLAQQARTLIRAALADNKRRIGAMLPRSPFGEALRTGLLAEAQLAGLPPPVIVRYQQGVGLESAVDELAAAAKGGIDALVLGCPVDAAVATLPALDRAGFGPGRVRLLGTAIWSKDTARAAPLAGAWFAAPDPETLRVFEQNYMSRYGTPPRDVASIAFDAAAAARAVTTPQGVNVATLLTPGGFSGADGLFVLLPDGHVRRALALFEISATGVHTLPPSAASPGM